MTTVPRHDLIAENHVQQQCAFPDAGLPDHVDVLTGVGDVQTDAVMADLRPADHLHAATAGDRRTRRSPTSP
jgi:hypothetical protein